MDCMRILTMENGSLGGSIPPPDARAAGHPLGHQRLQFMAVLRLLSSYVWLLMMLSGKRAPAGSMTAMDGTFSSHAGIAPSPPHLGSVNLLPALRDLGTSHDTCEAMMPLVRPFPRFPIFLRVSPLFLRGMSRNAFLRSPH